MRYLVLFGLSCFCIPQLVFGACCEEKPACPQKKCEEKPKPVCPKKKCEEKPKPVCPPKKCEKPKPVCPPKKEPERCPPKPKPCLEKVSCCWWEQLSECTPWYVQIRGAAFLPLNHKLREIYGTALPTLEVEASYSVYKNKSATNQLLIWGNVGWTTKTGETIGFGYYTKLNLIPFTAGLEYQMHITAGLDFYVGLGAAYSLLRVKNYDGFTESHLHKNGWGFTPKLGFRYTICKHFFFDAFADYYWTRFGRLNNSIQSLNRTFSAFNVGAGIGAKF